MRTLITLSALALLPLAAHARDNENLLPKPLPEKAPGKAILLNEPQINPNPAFKGPALKGLLITSADDKTSPTSGITVKNLPDVNSLMLEETLQPFLGKPVTVELLNDITRAIVLYYKKNVHNLVDVIAPAGQNITDGTVHFVVITGKLGTITPQGNQNFSNEAILRNFTTKPGDAINSQTMMEDLDWANRNPFRRVDLLYKRGVHPGETDVILNTTDRKPWRIYAGADDTGTDLTGNTRLYTGFNLGNLCKCEQQLNYQFTASDDFRKMKSHALSYTNPLPWRHLLTLTGSYQDVKPGLAAPLKSDGFAYDLGARYTIPLTASERGSQDVSLGYNFKRSNNNLEFGGTQVFNTSVDVSQFSGGYLWKQDDHLGSTAFTGTLVASPGGLTDKNSDAAHNIARAGASADYVYAIGRVERTTLLPLSLTLLTTGELQWANARLPGSEEISVGGYQTVRGYAEGETSGDNGFLLRNELRLPTYHLMGEGKWADGLTPLVFLDYATVSKNDVRANETSRDTLLSVGPGIRYHIGSNVDMRLDYGLQLRSETSDLAQRAHAAITISY